MVRNIFIVAWRNLQKQRMYGVINVLGLSVGVACCILISLYVWDELHYDKHHANADRIYRVHSDINFGGKREIYAVAQAPLAEALRTEIPGVESACRFRTRGRWLVRRSEVTHNINEERIVWADHEVFDVFTIPLIAGDPQRLLKEPNTLVLSATAAQRHFGDENPVGKEMVLNNKLTCQVTGVYEDIPGASHFKYDIMISMAGLEEARSPIWLSHNFQTYFTASPGQDPEHIEASINTLFRKYAGPQVRDFIGASIEEIEAQGNWARYALMPLTDIHLHSHLIAEHEPNSDITYVWMFSAVALFILLIACINFMNLATARSSGRSREIGVRKVLGSHRQQLVLQFLTEAVLMSIMAFVLAVILACIAMPFFNSLASRRLAVPLQDPGFIGLLAAGALLTGFLAGSYPAFYLSSFRPVEVLKGKLQQGTHTRELRNGLVVFQFAISAVLITGTIVIYHQLNYILNKRVGFNKEQVFLLHDTHSLQENYQGFRQSVQSLPEVESLTSTCYLPVISCRSDETVMQEGKSADQSAVSMQCWNVDYDYLATLGMEMAEGRFFSRQHPTDSFAVVLNETAVKKFGLDDPIGQRLWRYTDQELKSTLTFTVIGVVRDFHFESLRDNIHALGFFLRPESTGMMAIRFDAAHTSSFIDKMKSTWQQFSPGQPFNYGFLDDRFRQMYDAEQRLGNIFIAFAVIAIFIACLGFLALTAFTTEQRTKEIGVRKVLGASVGTIIGLLSKDFLRLVLIALIVACPVAWYISKKWLDGFAFRIKLDWWIFVLSSVVAIVIALLTVSLQSIKAAMTNPVDSLRSE